VLSERRSVESEPRSVLRELRSVERERRPVLSELRSVESEPRSVRREPHSVESEPRPVLSERRSVESEPHSELSKGPSREVERPSVLQKPPSVELVPVPVLGDGLLVDRRARSALLERRCPLEEPHPVLLRRPCGKTLNNSPCEGDSLLAAGGASVHLAPRRFSDSQGFPDVTELCRAVQFRAHNGRPCSHNIS
jgi:hypothetical protein